jgi:hypothetical protein
MASFCMRTCESKVYHCFTYHITLIALNATTQYNDASVMAQNLVGVHVPGIKSLVLSARIDVTTVSSSSYLNIMQSPTNDIYCI